jgi:hypothetical protein
VTQSAKRYGLDAQDPELESRIRRIEVALAALGPETASSNPNTTSRGGGTPDQITGLTLSGTGPGTFTFQWSAATISDLRKYEIQIAEDVGFTTGVQNKIAATTEYAFTTGDTSVTRTYFVRVRAVNTSDTPGAYSATLNTTTGQVTTPDIEDTSVTDPKLESTAVASGRVLGHLSGGILSTGADPLTDVDISAYAARDFTDTLTMTGSATTKLMDAQWDTGSNAGGLPSALFPVQILLWHHVFVISNADGTTQDAGFDTSLSAVNLLADSGLTLYRRVGSVLINSSSQIIAFRQYGGRIIWETPILEYNQSGGIGTAAVLVGVSTPLGVITQADLGINITNTAGSSMCLYASSPDALNFAPTSITGHVRSNINGSNTSTGDAVVPVPTDILSRIRFRINTGGGASNVRVNCFGYYDSRGQDGGL